MAINHLDTELRVFTDYVFGFVSTAEGFVFLSGLVAGLVYTRQSMHVTPRDLRQKAWHRAGEIYCYHLCGFVAAFIGVQLLAGLTNAIPFTSPALFFQRPVISILLGALLLYQPGLFDILPLYCGFMMALPAVLAKLRAGRWGAVLAASFGLWLLSQAGLRDHFERWLHGAAPVNLGAFDPLAWQLLFVLGVFFGFHWARATKPLFSFRPAMLALCLIVAVPLWVLLKFQHVPAGLSMDFVWSLADKTHLAPLRLLNFIILAYLIAAVAVRYPRLFSLRPLAFLGQHSLTVFSVQAIACAYVLAQPHLADTFARRTLTALATVALMFVTAGIHRTIARRRADRQQVSFASLTPPEMEKVA